MDVLVGTFGKVRKENFEELSKMQGLGIKSKVLGCTWKIDNSAEGVETNTLKDYRGKLNVRKEKKFKMIDYGKEHTCSRSFFCAQKWKQVMAIDQMKQ